MERKTDLIREKFDAWATDWDANGSPDNALLDFLLDKIPDLEKGPILDVACGTGVITGKLAAKSGQPVLGMDLAPKMIEIAKEKYGHAPSISFLTQDFYEYEGAPCQTIVIHNAYPHFLDVPALSKKAASLLCEGGTLSILHSLGRKTLEHHHSGSASPISFSLDTPRKEAAKFANEFTLLQADEGDSFYYFILRKRA